MISLDRNYVISGSSRGKPEIASTLNAGGLRKAVVAASRGYDVTAYENNPSVGRSSIAQTQSSTNVSRATLESIMPDDPRIKRKLFRDMYYHDPVCGGAVDVYSTLPFSDFHLTGVKDTDVLDTYHRSLESLHLRGLLPGVSCDHLVLGTFIGSSIFDSDEKIFTAVMPQNIDECQIEHIPIFGVDPLIDLLVPKNLMSTLSSNDPRLEKLLASVPKAFIEKIKEGKIALQPENTVYIPRKTLTSEPYGTSFYERVLPIHIIEKSLMRGTIDQANRRQRALLHIIVGGDDDWVPTQSDLEGFRDLFAQADMDPTGAIITTRTGVNTNEVRGATDFWSVEQGFEWYSANKYRAFGLSEGILTGEVSLSTLDASLSVMLDNIRNFRAKITIAFFYEKIFPGIAAANDFRNDKKSYNVTGEDLEYTNYGGLSNMVRNSSGEAIMATCGGTRKQFVIGSEKFDISNLMIPKIVYHKNLSPEGDAAYLSILNDMTSMGVPVPISMLAAAGGLDINEILTSSGEDLKLRTRVAQYNAKIAEMQQEFGPQQQDDGSGGQGQQVQSMLLNPPSTGFGVNRVGLAAKTRFENAPDVGSIDSNGKRKDLTRKGKTVLRERVVKAAAEVLAKQGAQSNYEIKQAKKRSKYYFK